jgi:argininosuccinate lyase
LSPGQSGALWGGRFGEGVDPGFQQFGASVGFDRRLADQDLRGSLAHVAMLVQQGILSGPEGELLRQGLEGIRADLEAGSLQWSVAQEDVHLNIETWLHQRIGPLAGKLHTARSRNDQVATDFRLFVKEAAGQLELDLLELQRTLLAQARLHLAAETLLPGYTHLQVAQPILLAHWLTAYLEMFARDRARLQDARARMDECPLGAAALAGTSWPIDRWATAKQLGFARPMANSLDAVASRDFALEFLAACAIGASTLSRLAEELILYASLEFGFVELPDRFSTGSSIMPQKKNPDGLELIRGKSGRIYGDLMALLAVVKGLPLAYNKDLQEDKEPVFDAFDTLHASYRLLSALLGVLAWRAEVTARAAGRGYATATDLADRLAQQGLPFREAHAVVGRLVALCLSRGCSFSDLSAADLEAVHPQLTEEMTGLLSPQASVASRRSLGGTAPEQVASALDAWESRLSVEGGV